MTRPIDPENYDSALMTWKNCKESWKDLGYRWMTKDWMELGLPSISADIFINNQKDKPRIYSRKDTSERGA
jgi:hypothetical protein